MWVWCLMTAAAASGAGAWDGVAADERGLDKVVVVDWRSAPAGAVLEGLAADCGQALWIAADAREAVGARRISLGPTRLTRRQAARWAGRLAGLECVARGERLVVGRRVPAAWVVMERAAERAENHGDESAYGRRAALKLEDVTLTALCHTLRRAFGVEAVIAPGWERCQELVSLEGEGLTLREVETCLARELNCPSGMVDGVFVIGKPEASWGAGGEAAGCEPAKRSVRSSVEGDGFAG